MELNRRDNGRLIVKEYEGALSSCLVIDQNGHTKIGMLKRDYWLLSVRRAIQWIYRHALKDHGLAFNGKFVEEGRPDCPRRVRSK